MTLTFRGQMHILGINPFVYVSAARAKALKPGWRRPMPVLVRINGEPAKSPWRINMMPVGDGRFYLYLHGDVRSASDTEVGDTVTVELAFDDGYRSGPTAPMPATMRSALAKNRAMKAAWDALVPSRQKEIVRYLDRLKSDEARSRNLEKVLSMLARSSES